MGPRMSLSPVKIMGEREEGLEQFYPCYKLQENRKWTTIYHLWYKLKEAQNSFIPGKVDRGEIDRGKGIPGTAN